MLAQAVTERFPGARAAIGPPVEDGFYYDFELPRRPTEEDQAWVEERMKEIAKGRHPFTVREVSADEAREIFADQPFKLELIDGLAGADGGEGERITLYQQDTFVDLCRGPHVRHTGYIQPNAIKLMSVSGAYWRGDEKRESLFRFYGTAWRNKTELTAYLERLEEAKRRDHRKLGSELELFTTSDLVGAGFPLWLPNGAVIRRELEQFILHEERLDGYQHVYTPVLAKKQLFEISGHWQHYHENIFPPIQLDNEELVLRPMNCPHHILAFGSKPRSYRDLPVKLAELGMMHRYERSGVVGGLTRVRAMTLNDAHIFCTPEQIEDEIFACLDFAAYLYDLFGMDAKFELSTRPEKKVGTDEEWDFTEGRAPRPRSNGARSSTPSHEGDGAFYGPKLELHVLDEDSRRSWQLGTIQVDPQHAGAVRASRTWAPARQGADAGTCVHRALLGSLERFSAASSSSTYGGRLPGLARARAGARDPGRRGSPRGRGGHPKRLLEAGARADVDERDETVSKRIRDAELEKIPRVVVYGDKESDAALAVRERGAGQATRSLDELIGEVATL